MPCHHSKELEENEEYAEKEDEFDIKPQDELKQLDDDEEELIDIVTIEQTEVHIRPSATPSVPPRSPLASHFASHCPPKP